MKEEKIEKKKFLRNVNGKFSALSLSIMMLLTLAVGGTLAYIAVSTKDVTNQFTPAQVSCEVIVNGKQISVKNTSDIDAYLRAAIVVNWVSTKAENVGNVRGIAPIEGTDYSLSVNSTENNSSAKWSDIGGYYYFKDSVNARTVANVPLISDIQLLSDAPSGYELSVEVVAEAIQAEGVNANEISPLQLHWGDEVAKFVGIYKEPDN